MEFEKEDNVMASVPMRQRAYKITYFVTVQLIALVGWIIVQAFFSLSPLGHNIPFAVTIVIETIWWIATLVIMFVLFRREYNSFGQAVVDLEEANKILRQTTSEIFSDVRIQG